MALDIELYRRTLYAPARDRWQSPETVADRSLIVTIQVLDSSPHVLDKSTLYSGSRRLVLRACADVAFERSSVAPLQRLASFSAAGMAAAGCHARSTKTPCEPPKVVRSPEQLHLIMLDALYPSAL